MQKVTLPSIKIERHGAYFLLFHVNHCGASDTYGSSQLSSNASWIVALKRNSNNEYIMLGNQHGATIPISNVWDNTSSFITISLITPDEYTPEFTNHTGIPTSSQFGSGFRLYMIELLNYKV